MSPLVPLFGLLIMSTLGKKVRINFLTYVLCCLHVINVTDLPLGVAPADLLVASMVDQCLFPIYSLKQFYFCDFQLNNVHFLLIYITKDINYLNFQRQVGSKWAITKTFNSMKVSSRESLK